MLVRIEDFILQTQRGDNTHVCLVILCKMRKRHGVHKVLLIVVEARGHGDVIEFVRVVSCGILPVYADIRHFSVCHVEKPFRIPAFLIVLLVLGMGKGELRREAKTVRHLVVKVHQRRNAVKMLFDHRTRLVVVTHRYTVARLVATTGYINGIVVSITVLCHSIHPVGVVVELLIFRESRVIVELWNIARILILAGIEISLFHEHGVVITRKHLAATGLFVRRELEKVLHLGRAFDTSLGLNHNHTVGTTRTIDCGRSTILKHRDFLDILGVDAKEVGKLLGSGVGIVERTVDMALIRDVVEYDKRGGVRVDRAGTANTHRRT